MDTIEENKNLDVVMDVNVELSVQLGSCELPMREVVGLNAGTVVQLRQKAKDPVSLFVNGKLVAYGEDVVMEDNFGIKVTELVGDKNKNETS